MLRRDPCAYCGESVLPRTIDHITPFSKGGLYEIGNLAPACAKCNKLKGDKSLLEWIAFATTARGRRGGRRTLWWPGTSRLRARALKGHQRWLAVRAEKMAAGTWSEFPPPRVVGLEYRYRRADPVTGRRLKDHVQRREQASDAPL